MGSACILPHSRQRFWSRHPDIFDCKQTFEALRIRTDDVARLHEQFEDIDQDGSSRISLEEFFAWSGLRKSVFGKRVFSLFDDDGSGELDFREFVVSLWNYLTADKLSLISFAFDVYDADRSGTIDTTEFGSMLKEVYGEKMKTNSHAIKIQEKIKNFSGISPGQVSKHEFVSFCRTHPALLFPTFQIQKSLQQSVCGEHFWDRLGRARVNDFGEKNVDIEWLRSGTFQRSTLLHVRSPTSPRPVRLYFHRPSHYEERIRSSR